MTLYKIGDPLNRDESKALGLRRDNMAHIWGEPSKSGRYARAVRTYEFRSPKAGEWYLSGAIPTAYRAPNDLSSEFHIMSLVAVDGQAEHTFTAVLMPQRSK